MSESVSDGSEDQAEKFESARTPSVEVELPDLFSPLLISAAQLEATSAAANITHTVGISTDLSTVELQYGYASDFDKETESVR